MLFGQQPGWSSLQILKISVVFLENPPPPLFPDSQKQGGGGRFSKVTKKPKFSAPSARILMYLHKVYTYKSLFLSLLAPQAIFFSFCTSFRSDFAIKITISKGKDETPIWKFSQTRISDPPKTRGFFSQMGGGGSQEIPLIMFLMSVDT